MRRLLAVCLFVIVAGVASPSAAQNPCYSNAEAQRLGYAVCVNNALR